MAAAYPYGIPTHRPAAFRLFARFAFARIERVWHASAPLTMGEWQPTRAGQSAVGRAGKGLPAPQGKTLPRWRLHTLLARREITRRPLASHQAPPAVRFGRNLSSLNIIVSPLFITHTLSPFTRCSADPVLGPLLFRVSLKVLSSAASRPTARECRSYCQPA